MTKKIQASEARIHTATVEVKTLTINGRQVTLSVFRQIPNENLLHLSHDESGDPKVTLNGSPWGTVNYYFDECKGEDRNKHLHVVWEKGACIYRSCVVHEELTRCCEEMLAADELYAADQELEALEGRNFKPKYDTYEELQPLCDVLRRNPKLDWDKKLLQEVLNFYGNLKGASIPNLASFREMVNRTTERYLRYFKLLQDQENQLFETLKALPQLYIAT